MSEATETSEQEFKHEVSPKKRVRHRKKLLYDNIRKQMEFYFSDANVSKDRFLGDLIKSDPYVPLDIFLKFNKIRAMTQDVVDITKALKHSTILELSGDKIKVQRKTPVLPYDADSRTVYVESIPVTASREWLQAVFSDYGKIAYISLPKFKNTQRIKGFAFIEFDKAEDAHKCLNAFSKMGCKLPVSMAPEELSTIKMFSVDEPEDNGVENKKLEREDSYEPPKKKSKKGKDKKAQKNLELKLDSELESDAEKKVDTPVDEGITTDLESKDELTSQDESGKAEIKPRKKKTRKRSAKERRKRNQVLGKNEAPKDALWGLQVLSKSEWKALRNKYLNLQRKNMKEFKRNLKTNGHPYTAIPAPPMEIKSGITQRGSEAEGTKVSNTPLERVAGVFVKTELPEPCTDVRFIKRQIRSNVHVQHVDVKEGQTDVIIRFDAPEAASQYCSNTDTKGRVMCGPEEEEQWSRALLAGKRVRGRVRLLARADTEGVSAALTSPASPQPTATHIRFDDQ